MASINRTPSDKWKARIRLQGVSLSRTFTTRKAAVAWAKRKERELESDRALGYAESSLRKLTFGEVALAYLDEWRGKDKSRQARVRWWCERIGHVRILDVDKRHIREHLQAFGKTHSGGTVNRMQAAISAVFKWGRHELDLPRNPAREVRGQKEAKGRDRFLTREEIARLLAACRRSAWERLYLLVLMALNTGARRGELMGLKWQDIDFEASTALLRDTKNSEQRVLTLSPEVMAELGRHRPNAGKVVSLAQAPYIERTLVFHGRTLMVPCALDTHWHTALRRADISAFRFHDLRHTAASLLAAAGANLHEIGTILGHRNLTTTRRYAHLCIDSKRKLTDTVLGNLSEGNGHE